MSPGLCYFIIFNFQFSIKKMHPVISALERQRRGSAGRVFALIADRNRSLRHIIVDYIARLQRKNTPCGQAAVFTASPADRHHFRTIPHVKFFSPRRPNSIRGQTFQQIIIDGADRYAPSVPYYRGPFSQLPYSCFPTLPDRGGILIIIGNPFRTGRNHFRHFWKQVMHSGAFLMIDPGELVARSAMLAQKTRHAIASRPPRLFSIHNFQFSIIQYINPGKSPDHFNIRSPHLSSLTVIPSSAPRLRA